MKQRFLYIIGITISIVCAAALMFAVFAHKTADTVDMSAIDGVLDLSSVDLTNTIVSIRGGTAFYGERLADELDGAGPGEFDDSLRYGTHLLTLITAPGQNLILCGYSIDYSTRVSVDGKVVLEIGKVAETAGESIPRINYMSIPIHTADSKTEIAFEYSNFVHPDGGFVPILYLSESRNIEYMRRGEDLRSLALGGALLMFAVYFLLFSAFQREPQYAALALCCLLLGLRDQNFFVVHLLPPDYDWNVCYRLLVMMISTQFPALLLFLSSLFPKALNRHWTIIFAALTGVAAALHFILPTMYTAKLTTVVYILCIPYAAALVIAIVRGMIGKKPLREDLIALAGYIVLFVSQTYEAVLGRAVQWVTRSGATPIFMLAFVMLIAASIGMRIEKRSRELEESHRQGAVLEQLNLLNNEFLHRVAHELRTPLTVMSGYAQLTERQIERSKTDEKTFEHLKTISSEAQRLSELVSKLIDMQKGQTGLPEMEEVDISGLFESAAGVCRPMLLKNSNLLELTCPDGLSVRGNRGMLMQLLINLASNANRHTSGGRIGFTAEKDGDQVIIRVSDTGSGIPQGNVGRVFENGYSTDGGSGIGLTICRDAARVHGGDLVLESTSDKGSVFACHLPIWKDV